MKKSFPKGLFFALCYFFYTSIYLSRINLSMASPALLADGVLTEVELGFIGSAFSVIYAIGRLCNGVLGDRLAPWVNGIGRLIGYRYRQYVYWRIAAVSVDSGFMVHQCICAIYAVERASALHHRYIRQGRGQS